MKACPICQSTYDDTVDFCFKDGAPLEPAEDSAVDEGNVSETLSALRFDDLEPPDAISLSNIPSIRDRDLESAFVNRPFDPEMDPPEPTFGSMPAVPPVDLPEDDPEAEETLTNFAPPPGLDLPEDPSGLPEDPSGLPEDPSGLPEDPSGLPEERPAADASDLPEDPTGLPDDDEGPETADVGEEAPTEPREASTPAASVPEKPEKAGTAAAEPRKASSSRPKVEVAAPAPRKRVRPETQPRVTASGMISARNEEPDRKGGFGMILGIAALLLVGFIGWTLMKGGDETEGTATTSTESKAERADALPPLAPARSTGGATPAPEPEATPAEADEQPTEEDAVAEVGAEEEAPEADETPEPEPEVPESTPEPRTPAPRPEPTPEAAPEPPIAVVAEPTPAPAPEPTPAPTPAPSDNPWANPEATPAPAATVADPANPWGVAAAPADEGTVIVASTPGGAQVNVGGTNYGTTPATLKLAKGTHEIRISKDGYTSGTRMVKVDGAGPFNVSMTLESLAPNQTMMIILASNPGGAIVWVDGARKGPTPLSVPMTVGDHSIRMEAPNLPACSKTLTVTASTQNAFYDLNTCN